VRSYGKALRKGMDMLVMPNRVRVLAVMLALALVGGLLTLALLAKPTLAQGKGAVVEDFPLGVTFDSTCTGESIDIEGTLHTVNIFKARKDGGYHIISHYNLMNMRAVGETTGEEYVVPSSGTAVENFVADGQTVTGTVDINLTISKGSMPNQIGFARVHYILTSEGEVKAETIQFFFECQG
jgi:hypothetical protein